MNARMITGLSAVLLLVTGCAANNQPVASTEVSTLTMTQRYQAAVNSQAMRNGAEVHWVNLPDEGDLAKYADAEQEDSNGSN
jgi:hypothetical protein